MQTPVKHLSSVHIRDGAIARHKILKNYFILCVSIKNLKYLITKIEVGPPKILKNYFILCVSIKNLKYLATKIEVGPPKCLR